MQTINRKGALLGLMVIGKQVEATSSEKWGNIEGGLTRWCQRVRAGQKRMGAGNSGEKREEASWDARVEHELVEVLACHVSMR